MDNYIKGFLYEKQINDYLNSSNNVKISYLWKDIPEYILLDYGFIKSINDSRLLRKTDEINKLEDIGSDIIYINNDNQCIIVQCKNYTKNVRIKDIAGFSFILLLHRDKTGELYYTSKLSYKIVDNMTTDVIKLIHKDYEYNIEKFIITPYDYQLKIIDIATEYYKTNDNGILNLPCGVIFYYINNIRVIKY